MLLRREDWGPLSYAKGLFEAILERPSASRAGDSLPSSRVACSGLGPVRGSSFESALTEGGP